ATGLQLAKIAARCMAGVSLQEQGMLEERIPEYFAVKEAVFPFVKFPAVDTMLGPEMKSTGEVMGTGQTFGEAYAKAESGSGMELPTGGRAFLSVRDNDRPRAAKIARDLIDLGFEILATHGTARTIREAGIECEGVNKVAEGRPHIVDLIKNDEIDLIINTTEGKQAIEDSAEIRRSALQRKVAYTTTISGGEAICMALQHKQEMTVSTLRELHASVS
ncbi:carbamoyl phosphate synthase large subunit, partial [Solemya elarraichensis gill symbiont]